MSLVETRLNSIKTSYGDIEEQLQKESVERKRKTLETWKNYPEFKQLLFQPTTKFFEDPTAGTPSNQGMDSIHSEFENADFSEGQKSFLSNLFRVLTNGQLDLTNEGGGDVNFVVGTFIKINDDVEHESLSEFAGDVLLCTHELGGFATSDFNSQGPVVPPNQSVFSQPTEDEIIEFLASIPSGQADDFFAILRRAETSVEKAEPITA